MWFGILEQGEHKIHVSYDTSEALNFGGNFGTRAITLIEFDKGDEFTILGKNPMSEIMTFDNDWMKDDEMKLTINVRVPTMVICQYSHSLFAGEAYVSHRLTMNGFTLDETSTIYCRFFNVQIYNYGIVLFFVF